MPSTGDLCAIACGFFWSFAVILMRVSGFSIPAIPLTFFKSFVAILGFVGVLLVSRQPLWWELDGMTYLRLVASAVLGISMADTMFVAALNRLGASLQALADCIYAPAMCLVGLLLFGETLGAGELLGGALVVSGVFVGLVRTREIAHSRHLYSGAALAAGAHITMAFGILMVRDVFREVSLVWVAGFRFTVATAVLAGAALLFGRGSTLMMGFRKWRTWKLTLPMALLGPFLATLFWIAGFKYETAGRAAIYNQLSTVFIILLAWLVLREEMTRRKAVGIALALTGSVLVALG